MINTNALKIKKYLFNTHTPNLLQESDLLTNYWPIVYILSDDKVHHAYVGETTDALARMNAHLRNEKKNHLTSVIIISSEWFNKSATLDIEANLIKYMSGDGKYCLLNANVGIANHNYYQKKEVYWQLFQNLWTQLRTQGLAKHSLEHISNSDLFKYSPYKTLSFEQKEGLMNIMRCLLDEKYRDFIIEGGAGTGKTILGIFLFKLLHSDNKDFNFKEFGEDESAFIQLVQKLKEKYPYPTMALVVPMSSFRKTLQKVFKNIKGLTSSMVIGPAEVSKNQYDIILVDESHRLRRRVNLGTYFKAFDDACARLGFNKDEANELDWVLKQSKKTLLFYDSNQSIKPSDVKQQDFDLLKERSGTYVFQLKSQFRVHGGNSYVQFIDSLLKCDVEAITKKHKSLNYELRLFKNLQQMVDAIKLRDQEYGLSRLIAGYSWEWISKNDSSKYDIEIEDVKLRWNSVSEDWINSANALNEVGCIHTTQGYDLNYSGIIFGNEITYNESTNQIEILAHKYFDKNGKTSIKDPEELKNYIINIYKTILLRGIKGTFIYACDEKLRDYLAQYIELEAEIEEEKQKPLFFNRNEISPFKDAIPYYHLKASAGLFSEAQNFYDDETQWLKIEGDIRISQDSFAISVLGNSMNKIIPNGAICLFSRYHSGSRNGKIVLVELTDLQDPDTGSAYTVKEYQSFKTVNEDGWYHQSIVLKPLSNDSSYKDLVLSESDTNHHRVIGIFERVI